MQNFNDRERIENYLNTLFETMDSLQAEIIRTGEEMRESRHGKKVDKYELAVKWGKVTESLMSVQNKIVAVQHILDIID